MCVRCGFFNKYFVSIRYLYRYWFNFTIQVYNCGLYLFIHLGKTFTVFVVLFILFLSIDSFWTIILGARECSNSTKAHLTRCDMYYKCTVMPSGNVVWVPKNCPNGLVYDTTFRNCVIPGEQKKKKDERKFYYSNIHAID